MYGCRPEVLPLSEPQRPAPTLDQPQAPTQRVEVTFQPDPELPADGHLLLHAGADGGVAGEQVVDELAATARRLGLPAGTPRTVPMAVPGPDASTASRPSSAAPAAGPTGLGVEPVTTLALQLAAALPILVAPRATPRPWATAPWPGTLAVWAHAAGFGLSLAAAHRLLPGLVHGPGANGPGHAHAVWHALAREDARDSTAFDRLVAALPGAGHALVRAQSRGPARVWAAEELLQAFLDAVVDHCARQATPSTAGPPRARLLPWTARWAAALADPTDAEVPLRDDAAEIVAAIAAWQTTGVGEEGAAVELALSAPEDQDGPWRLDLGIRTDGGRLIPAAAVWAHDHGVAAPLPAGPALRADLEEVLLRGLGRCARVFPPLDAALGEPAPAALNLSLDEAWLLLRESVPLLEHAGVRVRLPAGLEEGELRLRVRVGAEAADAAGQNAGLTGFRWEVAFGEETLSDAHVDALRRARVPLLHLGDRWLRLDPEAIRQLGVAGVTGHLGVADALGLALAGRTPAEGAHEELGAGPGDVEVIADGRICDLVARIRAADAAPAIPAAPAGFHGTLRPYQRRGVAWLAAMGHLGLGAVLADAMGLGKTIQLIAHLLLRDGTGPHLVVCPTSVVGNWQRELARFAPGMPVTRHHGADRAADLDGIEGVVVTSYGTVRRDADLLAGVGWDTVTVDEAQHVKNPTTVAARALARLRARQVIALTGTPLENRLADLWALLNLTNPGLLGTRARFARRFAGPIEQQRDRHAATRLRAVVAPFVLRREKTDPEVAAELPPKIERTVVCSLTPEQAELYEAAVAAALGAIRTQPAATPHSAASKPRSAASPIQRSGRVLALLTALKQVCNHPVQYRRQTAESGLVGRSGKFAVARELVAEAVDAGEQVLVFTQYVTMGELLVAQLSADLGVPVPFLHGGVSATGRDRMVAAFQGEADGQAGPSAAAGWPPVLVISLRAGGTGLNLTAATHVIHYDRWWNPAVEDQATDRAHRIGQDRTVEVHKLVTAGTLEERIAELLERKRALAAAVVGPGETWITELDDAALAALVALSADAPIEDLDEDDDPIDQTPGTDPWDDRLPA